MSEGAPVVFAHFPHFFLSDLQRYAPTEPVTEAGVGPAIIGTIEQVGLAGALAVPIAVLCALFLVESSGIAARLVRAAVDGMSSLPTIIAGLFVFLFWIVPRHTGGWSGFAGSMALAILMIPVVTLGAEEALRVVPNSLREASYALGAPAWRTTLRVVLPTALSGLVERGAARSCACGGRDGTRALHRLRLGVIQLESLPQPSGGSRAHDLLERLHELSEPAPCHLGSLLRPCLPRARPLRTGSHRERSRSRTSEGSPPSHLHPVGPATGSLRGVRMFPPLLRQTPALGRDDESGRTGTGGRSPKARRLGVAPIACLLALLVGLLGLVAPPALSATNILGEGSSFAANEIQDWVAQTSSAPYSQNVTWTTSSSGDGRLGFATQTVDFAVTDITYQKTEQTPTVPFIYVPVTAGALAFMYNLPQLGSTILQLSSKSVCDLFTGAIQYWDDPDHRGRQPGSDPASHPGRGRHEDGPGRLQLGPRGLLPDRAASDLADLRDQSGDHQ